MRITVKVYVPRVVKGSVQRSSDLDRTELGSFMIHEMKCGQVKPAAQWYNGTAVQQYHRHICLESATGIEPHCDSHLRHVLAPDLSQ